MEKAPKTVKATTKVVKANKIKANEASSMTAELLGSATTMITEIKETATEVQEAIVETVAEINETIDFSDNIEKIKESAKAINSQLKDSATDIVSEVKEMGSEIRTVAVKGMKQVAKKADLNKNLNKVKAAARKINVQGVEKMKEVAEKVNEQIVENTAEFKETATKLANEVVENLKVSDRLTAVRGAVKNANAYVLETTNDMIDGLEINGLKWQGVTEKAVKTGLKLAENQQNLMFSTLEAVKTQIGTSTKRFKKLFA